MRTILWDDEATNLEFFFALSLTVLIGAFVFVALDYRPMDRRAPLAVGVPALVLSILITLSYVSKTANRVMSIFDQTVFAKAGAVADSVEEEVGSNEYIENGVRRAIGWLIVLGVLFFIFGVIVSALLFVFLYLVVEGKEDRRRAGITSICVAAAIYVMFELILQRRLYDGMLLQLLFG